MRARGINVTKPMIASLVRQHGIGGELSGIERRLRTIEELTYQCHVMLQRLTGMTADEISSKVEALEDVQNERVVQELNDQLAETRRQYSERQREHGKKGGKKGAAISIERREERKVASFLEQIVQQVAEEEGKTSD